MGEFLAADRNIEAEARIVADATIKDIGYHFSQGELFPDDSFNGVYRKSIVERNVGTYVLRTCELIDWRYRVALKGAGYDVSQGLPEYHNLAYDEVNEDVVRQVLGYEFPESSSGYATIGWHALKREHLQELFESDYKNLAGLTASGFKFDFREVTAQ